MRTNELDQFEIVEEFNEEASIYNLLAKKETLTLGAARSKFQRMTQFQSRTQTIYGKPEDALGDYHIKELLSQNRISKTYLVEKDSKQYQMKAYRKDKILNEEVLQQIV